MDSGAEYLTRMTRTNNAIIRFSGDESIAEKHVKVFNEAHKTHFMVDEWIGHPFVGNESWLSVEYRVKEVYEHGWDLMKRLNQAGFAVVPNGLHGWFPAWHHEISLAESERIQLCQMFQFEDEHLAGRNDTGNNFPEMFKIYVEDVPRCCASNEMVTFITLWNNRARIGNVLHYRSVLETEKMQKTMEAVNLKLGNIMWELKRRNKKERLELLKMFEPRTKESYYGNTVLGREYWRRVAKPILNMKDMISMNDEPEWMDLPVEKRGCTNAMMDIVVDLEQECVVCMENVADTCVKPCMHKVVCKNCSEQLKTTLNEKTCVVCRTPITDIVIL